MPRKTKEELLRWYEQFSKELYEKVQIDVTRKEDLGRVRVFKSDQWSVDNLAPDMQITFAYIPHDGTNYAVPEPPIGQYQDYARWMMQNLKPEVTEEQLQKLYDQSCAGELMVYKPGGSLANIQMVHTDADGNIKISVPGIEYDKEDLNLPEDVYPKPPKMVKEPSMADFGYPQYPKEPKNMNPSWIAKVLDFFGLHTEYTDLMDFEKAVADYPDKVEAWKNSPDGLAAYSQAVTNRAEYVQKAEAYMANPYSKHYAAFLHSQNRFLAYADQEGERERQEEHTRKEQEFLKERHKATPQGQLQDEVSRAGKRVDSYKDTEMTLYNIIGHDPHPENMPNYAAYKNFQYEAYELPLPQMDYADHKADEALAESWKDLAAVAGFAAISDYEILAPQLREGFNRDESASLKYATVFSNIFTELRSNVNHELPFVEPARQKAKEALFAYSEDNPEQLGKLIAHGLRHNMREAASLYELGHRNTWGFLYLFNKTVKTLDKHPAVWEASGLTQQEMDEARGYAELYEVLVRGQAARKDLLEYANGDKTLSPVELEASGKDALFASYVLCSVAASHREQTDKLDTPERQQIAEKMGKIPAHQEVQAKADEFKRKLNEAEQRALATNSEADKENAKDLKEQAEALQEIANRLKTERDIASGKMTLFELKREGAPILHDLIKPEWVDAVKDQLGEQVNLKKLLSSSKNIVDTFHSDYALGMITKELKPKGKTEQMEKVLARGANEMENSEPQAPQVGGATM